MTYKIKVQDGKIVYSAADIDQDVEFDINGRLDVTKTLTVGGDTSATGILTTPPGSDLSISAGTGGNVLIQTDDGGLLLNTAWWPSGVTVPVPGMFIGASSANVLEYKQFILGNILSDSANDTQLNNDFPTASPGQSVIGPSVMYYCVAPGVWKVLGTSSAAVPYYIPENESFTVSINKQALFHMPIIVDGELNIDGFLIEV